MVSMTDDRCLNCNGVIREINYAIGPRWMHVDPDASFPTEQKGTAWRHCRFLVAEPKPAASSDERGADSARWHATGGAA